MIKVTRLNGEEIVVNADLIEFVEATPDTLITLTTGKKLMVQEPVDAVVERTVQYRHRVEHIRHEAHEAAPVGPAG
jgi:flagellar protein FlbD